LKKAGSSWGAAALFTYAAAFSFAYVELSAGLGALILFGAVQVTMIGWDIICGRRLTLREIFGLLLAGAGLVAIALPGVSMPDPFAAALMGLAGGAWGVYSLLGKRQQDFARATTGNFLKSLVLLPILLLASGGQWHLSGAGVAFAVISGAVTSGFGYLIWYAALPLLSPTQASISQLSVPVLAAALGVLLLGEGISLRLGLCSAAILGGVALALVRRRVTLS
jgi:drug/metabolite transporter (DMT)-like permease